MRRRSAASASRERVKAFSFTRSCCRAAFHSSADTIGGVFIAASCVPVLRLAFGLSSLRVDIFVVPFIRWNNRFVWMVFLAYFYGERCQPARRDRGGND
jgi:hypothetical protein